MRRPINLSEFFILHSISNFESYIMLLMGEIFQLQGENDSAPTFISATTSDFHITSYFDLMTMISGPATSAFTDRVSLLR